MLEIELEFTSGNPIGVGQCFNLNYLIGPGKMNFFPFIHTAVILFNYMGFLNAVSHSSKFGKPEEAVMASSHL